MSSKEHQVHPDCPHPERWSAPDREATEHEVTEFLGALVKALRPDRVLETGAYLGYTTIELARAAQPYGHVDVLEIDPELALATETRCKHLPVSVYCTDSAEFTPQHDYDFMFFDSGMEARIEELRRFRDFASDRCIFAIHDSRGHWIQQALREVGAAHVNLPTPRGITIGRYL